MSNLLKNITSGKNKGKISLNGVLHRPFKVGELPNRFGFIYSEEKEQDGITGWFNKGGLTYIADYYFNN